MSDRYHLRGDGPATLRLHDTLTGTVREFKPRGRQVTLYVCGITPYDSAHLGHAYTYAAFDVLARYLTYLGHEVKYVQNITDIDDPLFERANQTGVSYIDLAGEQIRLFLAAMEDLNLLTAGAYPRASQEVGAMVDLVKRLLEKRRAYRVDGFVYFGVGEDPDYGKLSKLSREEMIRLSRERGGDPDDPRKRDPLDFMLWRPSRPDEPREPSPWGEGLPGWHLECSAMSLKYLGAPIDIHGGGDDLIFPHHESEIAESESVAEAPFARHWMHTGMVHMGGEKMSKSLGNMVFVHDLMDRYGPDSVRLYLAGNHYRSELHWDEAALNRAAQLAARLKSAARAPGPGSLSSAEAAAFREGFEMRLYNDLDTPGAVGALTELSDALLRGEQSLEGDWDGRSLLLELAGILGLRLN